jgi:hypothetical protein
MKTLFHVFAHDQPLLKYESMHALFISLGLFKQSYHALEQTHPWVAIRNITPQIS